MGDKMPALKKLMSISYSIFIQPGSQTVTKHVCYPRDQKEPHDKTQNTWFLVLLGEIGLTECTLRVTSPYMLIWAVGNSLLHTYRSMNTNETPKKGVHNIGMADNAWIPNVHGEKTKMHYFLIKDNQ